MRKIIILIFTIIFFLLSCKGEAQKNDLNKSDNTHNKNINFDSVLKSGDYTWNESYFMTADYGVIYNEKTNPFGNLTIYLIPKNKLKIKNEQIEQENNRVNGLSIDEYKKKFRIIIFLIDKKDLNYAKSGDPFYYQKPAYEEKIYSYDENVKQWIFIDSIKILNEGENEKEQAWREKYISDQIQSDTNPKNSNAFTTRNLNSKKIIDSIAGSNYFLVEEQECDLNNDTFRDKIIVLGNNHDIDPQNPETRIAPILILLNEQNKKYKILTNENIYPNNFGDAFRRLVVKNQFFTIELSNEVSDKYISSKFITFKYDQKNIILHKYAEIINWSVNKTDKINYSTKDFGTITFLDYDSNIISEKVNSK
ncbi:hypothetical protein [Chryseobacterium salviniae]|uniref:Lipoprotein n=1 Tax=Chryseobacterium salviniae TaxID=3101750 RepID=A0ABU6HME7_9FLAO|nr:hypothetical protein [Chryseobacterium sp. T9W2-O]MEC3874194.1 hypothetical protein [Chryseobacterium sp. T9W2-O]